MSNTDFSKIQFKIKWKKKKKITKKLQGEECLTKENLFILSDEVIYRLPWKDNKRQNNYIVLSVFCMMR